MRYTAERIMDEKNTNSIKIPAIPPYTRTGENVRARVVKNVVNPNIPQTPHINATTPLPFRTSVLIVNNNAVNCVVRSGVISSLTLKPG